MVSTTSCCCVCNAVVIVLYSAPPYLMHDVGGKDSDLNEEMMISEACRGERRSVRALGDGVMDRRREMGEARLAPFDDQRSHPERNIKVAAYLIL